MVREIRVNLGDEDWFDRFVAGLENPSGLLRQLGEYNTAQAQSAFEDQRLGPWEWPQRYPNQEEPFVNIAAMVAGLAGGNEGIKDRWLESRRPALRDSGNLMASVTSESAITMPNKLTVLVGSDRDYASVHQKGGLSEQPITDAAKSSIADFIETPRGKPYWFKLKWLTGDTDILETQVNERPFLGITPESEEDMPKIVEEWVAHEFSQS